MNIGTGTELAGSSNSPFDSYARDYDCELNRGLALTGENKEYFARGRVAKIRAVLDYLGVSPRFLMDFGCGTGSTVPLLMDAWKGSSVIAVDPSAASLRVARAAHGNPRVRFELTSEYKPIADRDLVYCNGVFHHIPPAQRHAALDYISATLRPGGIFALCENNPWNPGTRYVMRRIPFDRDAIPLSPPEARRLLRAACFDIVRTDALFVFPHQLSWLRPMEPALTWLPIGGQYIVFCQKTA